MPALNWAFADTTTSGSLRLCLLALADRAQPDGAGRHVAWPGHEDLRRRINVQTTDSVGKYIGKLEKLGLIESLQTRQGKLHGYHVLPLSLPDQMAESDKISPDQMVGLTRSNGRADPTVSTADPTVSSSPIIGEPINPIEPSEPLRAEGAAGGDPASTGLDLPDVPPTLFTLEQALAVAEAKKLPASPELIRTVWLEGHANRNMAGWWRGWRGQTVYDHAADLERLLERAAKNGHSGKNGALSENMRVIELEKVEVAWREHVGNPQNGRTVTDDQREEFKNLTKKRRELKAGA